MNKKQWIGTMVLLLASMAIQAAGLYAETEGNKDPYLNEVRKLRIKVGAESPFSALHIADSHLTRVDARRPAVVRISYRQRPISRQPSVTPGKKTFCSFIREIS